MKRIFTLLILLTFNLTVFSQHIEWAKNIELPGHQNRELISDAEGNLYLALTYQLKSYLLKYDKDGTLLWQKEWDNGFVISKFIYDGNSSFYFSGYFIEQHIINNHTISSLGNEDGMYGKMDLSGNVAWIKTVNGESGIRLNGIAYNNGNLFLIGKVEGTYSFNGISHSSLYPSLLIAAVDYNGDLFKIKTHDFNHPDYTFGSNWGVEIAVDNLENIFILFDRKGLHPLGSSEPRSGRYISRLSNDFEILWSNYLNGSCYYGWKCRRLKLDPTGAPFILNYCSGKYGGHGVINKFNPLSGAILWSHSFKCDMGYTDYFFTRNNHLFLSGNEGASIFPGFGSTRGYHVIRIFDENLLPLGETRTYNVDIFDLSLSVSGFIFGFGYSFSENASVGSHKVTNGNFIMKINDIHCSHPVVKVSGKNLIHDSYFLCEGDTIVLEATEDYDNYLWSTGETSRTISTAIKGAYSVKVTQNSGCVASSQKFDIDEKACPEAPTLFYVTVVPGTNNCKLYFDSKLKKGNYVRILREDEDGVLKTIKVINDSLVKSYTDNHSPSSSRPVKYAIDVTENYIFNRSEIHSTIHLAINRINEEYHLEWTKAGGNSSHKKYLIYGGKYRNATILIDSVDTHQLSYNLGKELKYAYYRVEGSCDLPGKCFNSFSNSVSFQTLSVEVFENLKLRIYPNPANDKIKVETDIPGKYAIILTNIIGSMVFSSSFNGNDFSVPLENLETGLYILTVNDGIHSKQFKILKD